LQKGCNSEALKKVHPSSPSGADFAARWGHNLALSCSSRFQTQQLLLWLLLRPRNQTANAAGYLLLEHGIHQLCYERRCFDHSVCQLVDRIEAA
jgi:hypothetical protein